MDIKITKTQEIVDNVQKEEKYRIYITQHYGSGELHHEHSHSLYGLTLEDIIKLRDRLNKDFPASPLE
jgi:hypothetical protein